MDLDLDSGGKDLDLDLDLHGEDLDLDSGGKDLDLDLNFEDLTTSLTIIGRFYFYVNMSAVAHSLSTTSSTLLKLVPMWSHYG